MNLKIQIISAENIFSASPCEGHFFWANLCETKYVFQHWEWTHTARPAVGEEAKETSSSRAHLLHQVRAHKSTHSNYLQVCRVVRLKKYGHHKCRMGCSWSGQKRVKGDNFYKGKQNHEASNPSNHIVSGPVVKENKFCYLEN